MCRVCDESELHKYISGVILVVANLSHTNRLCTLKQKLFFQVIYRIQELKIDFTLFWLLIDII
jgi:hypothetical protein